MKKQLIGLTLGLTLAAGVVGSAFAQANPATLVKQRQSTMTLQGKYFFPLFAMASGRAPYDATIVARNTVFLESLTQMAWDGFNPSTANEKSNALPKIYEDAAGFKASQDKLHAEMAKLAAAAKSGNEAGAKAAIGEVGKVCGSCHDTYRAKS